MADKIIWVDPNGLEYDMSDQHMQIDGMSGRYMPPIKFVEEEVPFQHGKRLREVKVDARDVDLPLYIEGENEMELKNKLRFLMKIMNPLKGDGRFKSISPDGSQRELTCRYSGGLDISEKKGNKIGNLQIAILIFRAFDPFWYDSQTIVQTFRKNESPGLFFPILPLRVASSTVFADATIENNGDVETWPEWIITGPGENITLRNLTTGEVIELNHPDAKLEAGETVVIRTTPIPPNEKTVTKSDGSNWFYTLSDNSSLWSLKEGNNSIQLEMGNATDASSIQLSYRPRYWGP
jgi:hypothetical protein